MSVGLSPGDCCGCSTGTSTLRFFVACGTANAGTTFVPSPTAGVSGATVRLYSDSGRTNLVATGATNSVGRVDFTSMAAGTYYVRITGPTSRWSTYNPTSSPTVGTGGTASVGYALAPAAGFYCRPCCGGAGEPIPDTLHATTTWGSTTLTRTGNLYEGTVTAPVSPTNGCPAGDVVVTISLGNGCALGFGFMVGSAFNSYCDCPGQVDVSSCVDGSAAPGQRLAGVSPTATTGPCDSSAFTASVSISGPILGLPASATSNGRGNALQTFFGGPNYAFDATVTE